MNHRERIKRILKHGASLFNDVVLYQHNGKVFYLREIQKINDTIKILVSEGNEIIYTSLDNLTKTQLITIHEALLNVKPPKWLCTKCDTIFPKKQPHICLTRFERSGFVWEKLD